MCKSEEGKGEIECTYMSKHKREGKKWKKSASVWVSKSEEIKSERECAYMSRHERIEEKSKRVRVNKWAKVRRGKVKANARI
jgi:hypothetical protein